MFEDFKVIQKKENYKLIHLAYLDLRLKRHCNTENNKLELERVECKSEICKERIAITDETNRVVKALQAITEQLQRDLIEVSNKCIKYEAFNTRKPLENMVKEFEKEISNLIQAKDGKLKAKIKHLSKEIIKEDLGGYIDQRLYKVVKAMKDKGLL